MIPAISTPGQPALRALEVWLCDHHYSAWCVRRILTRVEETGELASSVAVCLLDAEDEATVTEVYIEAMDPVSQCSSDWDDQTFVLDAEMLLEGNHPWPIPIRPEDDDNRTVPPDAVILPPELEPLEEEETGEFGPPPGIDPEPYEPTEEDLCEYSRWLAETEARSVGLAVVPISGGAPDQVAEARAWCDRHPLSEFNAIRPDTD